MGYSAIEKYRVHTQLNWQIIRNTDAKFKTAWFARTAPKTHIISSISNLYKAGRHLDAARS